ncbi:MAG: thioredoxin-like domain-containing protein [bacterium]|nr:thioredoxin-like domain-containing protein [bacterium]
MRRHARVRDALLLLVAVLAVTACGSAERGVAEVDDGATTVTTSPPAVVVPDDSELPEAEAPTATGEPQPTEDRSAEDPVAGPTEPVPVSWRQPAPEFPAGLDWLNTDLPLTIESLRGKIVMLDFWTYGCINCIHVIPDLERLEEEYADELVVIGVHSAKFDQESATENIRRVVLRYGVHHPVVNDAGFEIWRSYRVRAWPSTYVIDPAGGVVGYHSGEGVYEVVKPVLDGLVEEFADSIDRTPLALRLERQGLPETVFSFPGKVTVDPAGMLYVSDSNHHRIVVTDLEGRVEAVYGSGLEGFTDGPSSDATFRDPQGTALSVDGGLLYVADTGNHALRAVDLSSGEVTTVAGTGERAWPPRTGSALTTPLASPWDVELDPDTGLLYLAMAGTHQIWFFDPDEGTVGPYAGSGGEGTVNGPGDDATLAQPSGLALAGDGRLFFADSESSAIRWVDTESDERTVGIIAGSDVDLFSFGDLDGVGTEARLQHPLGVVAVGDTLYVADTYNSKIKVVDLGSGAVSTRWGDTAGWRDGDLPLFYEPGGIDALGSTLFVADTNNHSIRLVDLDTGEVSTLVPVGIEVFVPGPDSDAYAGTIVEHEPLMLGEGQGAISLDVRLPAGYKVNPDAPSRFVWSVDGEGMTVAPDASGSVLDPSFPRTFDVHLTAGQGVLTGDISVVYCEAEAEQICLFEQVRIVVPYTVASGGSHQAVLTHTVDLPDL